MPRAYVRKKPHNKVDKSDLALLQVLVEYDYPKTRIARTLGVSRRHLYRLIEKYCKGHQSK